MIGFKENSREEKNANNQKEIVEIGGGVIRKECLANLTLIGHTERDNSKDYIE